MLNENEKYKDLLLKIKEAINQIKDPCSCSSGMPAGLEEMGLIYAIDLLIRA